MAKKNSKTIGLPKRLTEKHGGYFYITRNEDGKQIWTNLGRDKQKAIDTASQMNALRRKEVIEMIGLYRNATKDVFDVVMQRDNYSCAYCGRKDDLGLDHVIPHCAGGSNLAFNMVVCCFECNSQKGDENPLVFLAKKSGILDEILQELMNRFRERADQLKIAQAAWVAPKL